MSENQNDCYSPCDPCGVRKFERNRYFEGKLLTANDFKAEQDYLRGKHRLHNSVQHGFGTVCGLRIDPHENPACRNRFVVLNPGLALDCCGNEIIVPTQQTIHLKDAIEAALREADRFPDSGNPAPTNIYIRLAYQECGVEKTPVLLDDCGCGENSTEFNRTCENWRLFVDLEEPASQALEALDARLDWQHTLTTAHPEAIVVDRDLERLYVVEWDGELGRLRMYNSSNHSQIVRVPVRDEEDARRPTAAALSNLGDLLYIAEASDDGAAARIVIFQQSELEGDPAAIVRNELSPPGDPSDIVRLEVSQRDDSLFVLTADGRIMRYRGDAIRAWLFDGAAEPEAAVQELSDATEGDPVTPVDMSQGPNGRWMVVADSAASRVVVVNLANFDPDDLLENRMASFPLREATDIPKSVEISFDGEYLYLLTVDSGDDFPQKLYRVRLGENLADFIPAFTAENSDRFSELPLVQEPSPGSPTDTVAMDLSVSPRDNWVYILRRTRAGDGSFRDRGDVVIVPVDALNSNPGPIAPELAAEMIREGVNIEGNALFHNLVFLGRRLYVAGEMQNADGESTEGRISILFVDEAACDTFIRRTLDGCPACDEPHEGVIIASILDYEWDEMIVADAVEGSNVIDNETYRPMAPSTSVLLEVIRCMLEKGISEGIPGARGPAGPEGPDGQRGPGVTEAAASLLAPGDPPTAILEPIAGDPEGDQRLLLGLPPGPRGPGIQEVTATTLPPGSAATAALTPITGDPENDLRLDLGIPRGDTGGAPPTFNRIITANWHHDEILTPNAFVNRFIETNFVVQFEQPVMRITLTSRSVMLVITREVVGQDDIAFECDCILPARVQPAQVEGENDFEVEWLIGDDRVTDNFRMISDAGADESEFVSAVRMELPPQLAKPSAFRRANIVRVSVVLRGDYIIDEKGNALDGNNIWPGVPEGPTAIGIDGRPSGNGAQGDDWISIIHIDQGN